MLPANHPSGDIKFHACGRINRYRTGTARAIQQHAVRRHPPGSDFTGLKRPFVQPQNAMGIVNVPDMLDYSGWLSRRHST